MVPRGDSTCACPGHHEPSGAGALQRAARAVGLGLTQRQLLSTQLCAQPSPPQSGLRGIDVGSEESDMEAEEEPALQTLPLCRAFSSMDTAAWPDGSCAGLPGGSGCPGAPQVALRLTWDVENVLGALLDKRGRNPLAICVWLIDLGSSKVGCWLHFLYLVALMATRPLPVPLA